jgi:hypothetical protein
MTSCEDCLASTLSGLARSLPSLPLEPLRRAYEVALIVLFVIALAQSRRTHGAARTGRELLFGFAVSQTVELMAVAMGRYRYPDWLIYFPPRPAWVPLAIGLGWAALLPAVMALSDKLIGRHRRRWQLALLDGALAVAFDLVLDPMVSGPPLQMWIWRGDGMTPYRWWVLGVPLFNFVGWFVLVSACSFELRLVAVHGPRGAWTRLALFFIADLAIAGALFLALMRRKSVPSLRVSVPRRARPSTMKRKTPFGIVQLRIARAPSHVQSRTPIVCSSPPTTLLAVATTASGALPRAKW